jgi:HEPN domain-containing protein
MRKETEHWWMQAKRDLVTASNSLNSEDYYACAFFVQQAVEKALKALILFKNKEKIMGHSLVHLGNFVGIPIQFVPELKKLSPQYFLSRYPDASEEIPYELYDEGIAKDFLKIGQEILTWIENQLK